MKLLLAPLAAMIAPALVGLSAHALAPTDPGLTPVSGSDTQTTGLFSDQAPTDAVVSSSRRPTEVGTSFTPEVDSTALGVQVFKLSRSWSTSPTTGTLWSSSGTRLASASFTPTDSRGWLTVRFSQPVDLTHGRTYTVSAYAPHGKYAVTKGGFTETRSTDYLTAPAGRNGVRKVSSTSTFPTYDGSPSNYWVDVLLQTPASTTTTSSPSPTTTTTTSSPSPTTTTTTSSPSPTTTTTTSSPSPTTTTTTSSPSPTTTTTTSSPSPATTGGWPGPDNTGVPAGTTLQSYTGPCTITSTVTITGVDATGKCGEILVRAPNVVISKSKLPRVDATNGGTASVSLVDDTVLGGQWSDGAIWGYNIQATRVNVTGGQHTFHCADNCTVTDSWLHDQYNPAGQSYHNNAFISNGGSNMVIRHNTLHCTPLLNSTDGGCSGDLSLFGDFDPISHVTIDNNLFKANNSSISYCLYAGWNPGKPYGDNPTYVQVTNNVFERGANGKCGVYGPVTSYKADGTGNTWSNNTWDQGGAVSP